MKHTTFTYDAETHTTTCTIRSGNKIYTGTSQCHQDDYDFESQKTGEVLAHFRAVYSECLSDREEINAQIKILNHVYDAMMRNPKVDKTSPECSLVRKQIKLLKREKEYINDTMQHIKAELKYLIKAKDELYTRVRQRRAEENAVLSTTGTTETSIHS